jgi:CMP-2-keto-3-deoxyoctulosonic acid synthetase
MIQRVYNQVSLCREVSKIIIATDDERIFDVVTSYNFEALMTSEKHISGTDRVLEVVTQKKWSDDELIITTRMISMGNTIASMRGEAVDRNGRIIATASTNMLILK